ncbi:MAG: hypothetical protein IJL85_04890 [Erysipelotrichaceae bacterium]|nr:hypothetical protein [Erysipelotrichaceae bacterium]
MKEKERVSPLFRLVFGAGAVIFGLLLILFVLTSSLTGISMSLQGVKDLFTSLFVISIYVLAALALFGFIMAAIAMKKNPSVSSSMVVRDNYLKYDYTDKDGKKKKKTFSLVNINKYLESHGQMKLIDDLILSKEGHDSKASIRNLMVGTEEGEKKSLATVYNEDPAEYQRIAAFLDHISARDEINLEFRLNTYIFRENMAEEGQKLQASLRNQLRNIQDEVVCSRIIETIQELQKAEQLLSDAGYDDRLRKLYMNYMPMLTGIIETFGGLDRNDQDLKRKEKARTELMQTFDLILAAFASLNDQKEEEGFDRLEAASDTLEKIVQTGHEEVRNG